MQKISLSQVSKLIAAIDNCKKSGNKEWQEKHRDALELILENLPHGSGIDADHHIVMDKSTSDKIIFKLEFHHMNDAGYYDGWTTHFYRLTPSFSKVFDLAIGGPNKNNIKEYLTDLLCNTFEA